MRVAIVGAGAFAKYFVEEFPAAGIEVVVLTRSHKDYFDGKSGLIEQRITDYSSVPQLVEMLGDCDAVVGTISDTTQAYVDVHLALLEACKQTPKCKRFIPSEYGGDSEDYLEDPNSLYKHNAVVRDALEAQSEIEWTVICVGWLMDYVVASSNRYHSDLGPMHPLDLHTKTMTIPGTGNEPFATTSTRDVGKAVAALLKSTKKWPHYTHVQALETTWLQVAEQMKTFGGMLDLNVSFESVDELQKVLAKENPDPTEAAIAEFKLYVPLGALKFDQEKAKRDRDEFFRDIHFRTMQEVLLAAQKNPKTVV